MLALVLCFIFLSFSANGSVINNVRVKDHVSYVTQLMQETIYEIESRGWSSFKLLDINQEFDTDVYGWEICGNVTYTNGFLVSVHDISVLQSSVQQIWGAVAADGTVRVSLNAILRMHEVALGYDIIANMTDGIHHHTGIYTHETVDIQLTLARVINTETMTTSGTISSLSAGNVRRMIYMPVSRLTEYISRNFAPSSSWNAISRWIQDVYLPTLLHVAETKVQFPGLCYNCS